MRSENGSRNTILILLTSGHTIIRSPSLSLGGTAGVLGLKPNGPCPDWMKSHVQYIGFNKVAGSL